MKRYACLALAALAPVLLAQPATAQRKKPAEQQQEGQKKDDKYAFEQQFPTKATWVISSANGKPAPIDATMLIDENLRGTGMAGCNSWSATLYPVKGKRLAMGPVAMTKKSCSPEINAFERLFLTVLHTGPTWELAGSTLTVKSQAGTLVFNRGL